MEAVRGRSPGSFYQFISTIGTVEGEGLLLKIPTNENDEIVLVYSEILMVNEEKFCHFEKGANLVWMIWLLP